MTTATPPFSPPTGTPPSGAPTGLTPDPNVGRLTGQNESLANWVGPYVTDMLGRAQAISGLPYQTYQGPLTAGTSNLQQQAFTGIGSLGVPSAVNDAASSAGQMVNTFGNMSYSPVGTSFTADGTAQQYMNPYLQQALDPTLKELQRQAQITQMQNAGRMTRAGSFGGGRQAILEGEQQRNLMDQVAKTTGEGYATAYDKAASQFNAEQARKIQESQFGSTYGLDTARQKLASIQAQGNLGQMQSDIQRQNLNQQLTAGTQQRAIEQEGITADMNEFLAQRDYPLKQVQFLQSMLQGLPISAVSNQYQQPSGLSQFMGDANGILALYRQFFGNNPPSPTPTPTPAPTPG